MRSHGNMHFQSAPNMTRRSYAAICAMKMRTRAMSERDPALIDSAAECFDSMANSFTVLGGQARVNASILRHDWSPALGFVQAPAGGYAPEEAAAVTARLRLKGELERGSLPDIASALDAFRAAKAKQLQIKGSERLLWCRRADGRLAVRSARLGSARSYR